jgi:4'-phosphopantetheinyl transferase
VWFLDRTGPPDCAWLEVLDQEERERAMGFRTQEQRDAFAAAHALVRTALSAYGRSAPPDWRFAISPQGRPSVLDAEISFSLTHAGPWAAVAIGAGQALGLDLEPIRPERDALPLARRFFAAAETEWLTGLPRGERPAGFAALWTVKEAVLKARGCGLTESLRSVEVELDPSGRPVRVQAPGGPWALRSWSPEPGWFAALAVPMNGTLTVATFRAKPLGPPVPAPEMKPERSLVQERG